jgi:hypothetical protein
MDSAWAFRAAFDEARKIRDAQDVFCAHAEVGLGWKGGVSRELGGNHWWMYYGEESRCAILLILVLFLHF